MNLSASVSARYYFVLLLIIPFFSACERPKGIGFELVPQGEVGVFFTDTLTVKASTILDDSVVTSNALTLLVGQYQDPVLGKVTAKCFFQLPPSTDSLSLSKTAGREPIYDSIRLSLSLPYLYANTAIEQKIGLFRLRGDLNDTVVYRNNSDIIISPRMMQEITLKGDDFQNTDSQTLTVKLENGFGQEIFDLANRSPKLSNEEFLQAFKGFALVPDASTNAGIIGINVNALDTRLILYYREPQPRDGQADTIINRTLSFFIASGGARFNQIKQDRSGTALTGIVPFNPLQATLNNHTVYIQAGAGLRTKIEFPTLSKLKNLGNITINKAELVIKPVIGSVDTYFPPNQLILFETDQNNKVLYTPVTGNGVTVDIPVLLQQEGSNPFGYENPIGLNYDLRNEEYRLTLSSHLQYLLTGLKKNSAFLLSTNAMGTSVNRIVINTNPSSPFATKLRVYYTLFK